jgi:hypothetical protein
MILPTNTLDQLKKLEFLYHQGYQSDVVDLAVGKIIALESEHARQELDDLVARLIVFEQKYQMQSKDFYTLFHAGKLGDDADYFEWSALHDMAEALHERLQSLEPEML